MHLLIQEGRDNIPSCSGDLEAGAPPLGILNSGAVLEHPHIEACVRFERRQAEYWYGFQDDGTPAHVDRVARCVCSMLRPTRRVAHTRYRVTPTQVLSNVPARMRDARVVGSGIQGGRKPSSAGRASHWRVLLVYHHSCSILAVECAETIALACFTSAPSFLQSSARKPSHWRVLLVYRHSCTRQIWSVY